MSAPISRLDRALHALLWALAVLVIPLAVLVGIGRELLPAIGDYRDDIARSLSQRSGVTIRLDRVEGRWQSLSPTVRFAGVRLYASGTARQPALTLPAIEITPDWWSMLRDRGLRFRITLDGLTLTFAPDDQGGVKIREFAGLGASDPVRARETLSWLLAQPQLLLTRHRLAWKMPGASSQKLHDVRLQQYRSFSDYRVRVAFRLSEQGQQQEALLRVEGDPLAWRESPWQLWLNLKDVRAWRPWLSLLPASGQVMPARGDLALWLDSAQGGMPRHVTAKATGLALALTLPGRPRYVLEHLAGVVDIRYVSDLDWQVVADQLTGHLNGHPLPLRRAALTRTPTALAVQAARLSLQGLHTLLQREQLLPPERIAELAALQPEGLLPRLAVRLQQTDTGWMPAQVSAEFKALGWQARGSLPGGKQVSGWLQADADSGLVHLDAQSGHVDAPAVFRTPVAFDALSGSLRWHRRDDIWHVDSDVLHLSNPDAEAHAQFALRLPVGRPQDARLDLIAGLSRGRVASAWKYVPWHAAGDHTLDWLRRGLVGGEVTNGAFLYAGRLTGPSAGRFDMTMDLRDAEVDYLAGWPAITRLDGRLSILGKRLAIDARAATIDGATSSRIAAVIEDLSHSVLDVDADLRMDLATLDRLLADAPIRNKTGGVARLLALSGPATARLGLRIPLAGGPLGVTVDAALQKASIGLPAQDIRFEQVTGGLRFDLAQGLRASSLKGRLWGEPAEVSLDALPGQRLWQRQYVDVRAPVTSTALGRWLKQDLSAWVAGKAPVTVSVDIPVGSAGHPRLRVVSPLQGMRSLLPAPFAKPAEAILPLQYEGPLGSGEQRASLTVGDAVRAGLVWQDGRLDRLLVRAGVPGLAWPRQAGIHVEARLPVLDVPAWRTLLAARPARLPASAPSPGPRLRRVDVEAGRVLLGEQSLGATRGSLLRTDKGWQVHLKGLQPASLPAWPVTEADALVLHEGNQWQLANLVVSQPAGTFSGQASWDAGPRGRTRLKGQLDLHAIDRFMEHIGKPPFMSSELVVLKTDLGWPGQPDDFAMDSLDGRIEARIKEGRLRDVEGIPVASRLFGLMNASNILRRLRFDFTDVTRKGLNFDQITLDGDLKSGVSGNVRFDLEGPTMLVRGRGNANLVTRELDQTLRIGLPVSSALPLVGFLAGPIVGGALVAADLLFDKQLAKLTAIRYRLHGPWNDLKLDDGVVESVPKPAAGAK